MDRPASRLASATNWPMKPAAPTMRRRPTLASLVVETEEGSRVIVMLVFADNYPEYMLFIQPIFVFVS